MNIKPGDIVCSKNKNRPNTSIVLSIVKETCFLNEKESDVTVTRILVLREGTVKLVTVFSDLDEIL